MKLKNYQKKYKLDIELFTELIKRKCSEVGFSKSGIAPVKYHKEDIHDDNAIFDPTHSYPEKKDDDYSEPKTASMYGFSPQIEDKID